MKVNLAGSSVDFQTDGTSRCSVTTSIPAASDRHTGYGTYFVKSVGTTSRNLDLGYMEITGQLNTPR